MTAFNPKRLQQTRLPCSEHELSPHSTHSPPSPLLPARHGYVAGAAEKKKETRRCGRATVSSDRNWARSPASPRGRTESEEIEEAPPSPSPRLPPPPPPPPPFPPPLCGAGFRQADLLLPPPKSRRSSPTPLLFLPSQTPPGSSTHPGRGPPLPTGRPPGSHHSAAPTEPASNRRRRTDRDYVILTPASDILDCAPNPATSPQPPPPPLPRVRLIKWVVGKRGRSKSNSTGRKISFFSGISGRQCRLFLVCLFRGRHL